MNWTVWFYRTDGVLVTFYELVADSAPEANRRAWMLFNRTHPEQYWTGLRVKTQAH